MPAWRQMKTDDLGAVTQIAALVHPDYPEDDAVLAERLALYPQGCLLLSDGAEALGYLLSHPYPFGNLPPLDTLLGTLPEDRGTWYLHDIALLPAARGQGAAAEAIRLLTVRARDAGFEHFALTAIKGTAPFWMRQGFMPVSDPNLDARLKSYDANAVYMSRTL